LNFANLVKPEIQPRHCPHSQIFVVAIGSVKEAKAVVFGQF